MNIIFLNIDGVLSTWRYIKFQEKYNPCDDRTENLNFDPKCMRNLKHLIEKTNSNIVLTSSWRNSEELITVINSNFRRFKIDESIIVGKTKTIDCRNVYRQRGLEIKDWINTCNLKIDNFVILDDENCSGDLTYKLILCDEYYGFGITELNKALKLFK